MPKLSERGAVQFIVILILLLGIVAGVWLVQNPTRWLPKAFISAPIDYCGQFVTSTVCGQPSYDRCFPSCDNQGKAFYNCYPSDPEASKVCTGTIYCQPEDYRCRTSEPSPSPTPTPTPAPRPSPSASEVSCTGLTASLISSTTIAVRPTFSGDLKTLKIWMASNSEIDKPASLVQSWTLVKNFQNPLSGFELTFLIEGFVPGQHAILMSLHGNDDQMLDGNVGGVVNNSCTSSIIL